MGKKKLPNGGSNSGGGADVPRPELFTVRIVAANGAVFWAAAVLNEHLNMFVTANPRHARTFDTAAKASEWAARMRVADRSTVEPFAWED